MEQEDNMQEDSGYVEAEEIEVAGEIRDKYGNRWAIPAEGLSDHAGYVDPLAHSPIPGFYVQWIHEKYVDQYRRRGFVPCRREELGLSETLTSEEGRAPDQTAKVLDSVAVKIPQVLADRMRTVQDKDAKTVVEQLEPTDKMLRNVRMAGMPANVTRRSEVDSKEPVEKK